MTKTEEEEALMEQCQIAMTTIWKLACCHTKIRTRFFEGNSLRISIQSAQEDGRIHRVNHNLQASARETSNIYGGNESKFQTSDNQSGKLQKVP